jgi:uncharacterized protein YndB with AHSA1/START domain
MERRTKIHAQDGAQDLRITREFDLPLRKVFVAYTNPEIVEQWMNTKVLRLENRRHGSYAFETIDPKGNRHGFNGVIHEFEPEKRITRTFEMENTPFPVQLEYLDFEPLTETTSRLTIHIVFRSAAVRDALLKLPFEFGINMAHDRLEEIAGEIT